MDDFLQFIFFFPQILGHNINQGTINYLATIWLNIADTINDSQQARCQYKTL
jgi:hypothetical protein